MKNRIPYNEADENYLTIYDMMDLTGLSKSSIQRRINKLVDKLEKENPNILDDWLLKSPGKPTLYHKLFFEELNQEEPEPGDPPEGESPPDEENDPPPQPDPEPEPPTENIPKSMNYYFLLVFAILVVIFLFYFFS